MQTSLPALASDLPAARAKLAAARSRLLRQYVGLGMETLQSREMWPQTTPARALARMARRDDDAACSIETLLGRPGRRAHISLAGVTPDDAVTSFLAARSRLLSAAAKLHGEAPIEPSSPAMRLLAACRDLDLRWARRLEWWNEEQDIPFEAGPISVLGAAVRAARKELLTALALLPPDTRQAWQTDMLSRSAEETRLLHRLRSAAPPGEPQEHVLWEDAWRLFHDCHHALVTHLETGNVSALEDLAVYRQVTESIDQDRTVARAIRDAAFPAAPTAAPDRPAAEAHHTGPSAPERRRVPPD